MSADLLQSGARWVSDRLLPDFSLRWDRDGADWPNREASVFVRSGGIRWHVQIMGDGPVVLLLHGSGAATHSWRGLATRLAEHFTVVAPDLPGHGFSQAPDASGYALPAMADAVGRLLATLRLRPEIVVGHSAGAAVACRMCLDGIVAPRRILSLNGALLPPDGFGGPLWNPLARALAWNPFASHLLALRGRDRAVVERLLRGTGSQLDEEGIRLYQRLMENAGHVSAVIRMMARWELEPLVRALPDLATPLTLVVGDRDRYIPASDATKVRSLVRDAEIVVLPGLGHLAHEERPEAVEKLVTGVAIGEQNAPEDRRTRGEPMRRVR